MYVCNWDERAAVDYMWVRMYMRRGTAIAFPAGAAADLTAAGALPAVGAFPTSRAFTAVGAAEPNSFISASAKFVRKNLTHDELLPHSPAHWRSSVQQLVPPFVQLVGPAQHEPNALRRRPAQRQWGSGQSALS